MTRRAADPIGRLLAELDSEGEKGPRRAIQSLLRHGERALEQLAQLARDGRNTRVRRWAVEGLGTSRRRRFLPILVESLGDPHMTVRLHAIFGIERLGNARAAANLIPLLKDPSGGIRVNAVDALRRMGCRAALPELLAAAIDEKWYVRQHVATALGELNARGAVLVLRRLALDPHPAVRGSAQLFLEPLPHE